MNKKWYQGHEDPWWNDFYKKLDYKYFPIKNTWDEERWRSQGYGNVTLNGALYDQSNPMPKIVERFGDICPNWIHKGMGFYKMSTLDMLPLHQDHYLKYIELFKIKNPENIRRKILFLEDWKSGHYFEIDGEPIVKWKAGDWVAWHYDVEHFAANIGVEPRYTLQITGLVE